VIVIAVSQVVVGHGAIVPDRSSLAP
jgi:hypothetical protein